MEARKGKFYREKETQERKIRKITLEGFELHYKTGKEIYQVILEKDYDDPIYCKAIQRNFLKNQDVNNKLFILKEVNSKELEKYRLEGKPGFVLKQSGKYFYSEIEKDMPIMSFKLLGDHICVTPCVCKHISSDCQKVIEGSSNIERYNWITKGYETFNTAADCFVVISCNQYEQVTRKKPHLSPEEWKTAQENLRDFAVIS
ncbi:MAG: hypothetical protein HFJ40_05530 [Clostridia bacterium]|nr:hypothetical protein [Clostridia bacterium]